MSSPAQCPWYSEMRVGKDMWKVGDFTEIFQSCSKNDRKEGNAENLETTCVVQGLRTASSPVGTGKRVLGLSLR